MADGMIERATAGSSYVVGIGIGGLPAAFTAPSLWVQATYGVVLMTGLALAWGEDRD